MIRVAVKTSAPAASIRSLPEDLIEAIHLASESKVLRETLGDHVHEFLIRNKREEWDGYKSYVTPLRARAVPAHPVVRQPHYPEPVEDALALASQLRGDGIARELSRAGDREQRLAGLELRVDVSGEPEALLQSLGGA